MTTIAFLYMTAGLLVLIWPLVLLLFKRHVLGAQWMTAATMFLFGLSLISYSTLFNTFLMREYLMVILYMILSLMLMPMMQVSFASLTKPTGVPLRSRVVAWPSILVVLMMVVSVAIGGADMYRLWIERGADGLANRFFSGSWRYNLIVAVHFYLFWSVLVLEVLYLVFYVAVCYVRYRRILGEYYTSDHLVDAAPKRFYFLVGLSCLAFLPVYLLFPFNKPRPEWVVALFCTVETICMFCIGHFIYHLKYGAERLGEKVYGDHLIEHGDLKQVGRALVKLVEDEKNFTNPDLSVFILAERLNVSQDDIVDAVHHLNGTSFRDYIDGLRVEHAIKLFNDNPDRHFDDPDLLLRVAHNCGYITLSSFEEAFNRVMQTSVKQWLSGGGAMTSG